MQRQLFLIGIVLILPVATCNDQPFPRPTTFHTEIRQTIVFPGGQATISPQAQQQPQQQGQPQNDSDGPFFFIKTNWMTIDCPSPTTLITCDQTITVKNSWISYLWLPHNSHRGTYISWHSHYPNRGRRDDGMHRLYFYLYVHDQSHFLRHFLSNYEDDEDRRD